MMVWAQTRLKTPPIPFAACGSGLQVHYRHSTIYGPVTWAAAFHRGTRGLGAAALPEPQHPGFESRPPAASRIRRLGPRRRLVRPAYLRSQLETRARDIGRGRSASSPTGAIADCGMKSSADLVCYSARSARLGTGPFAFLVQIPQSAIEKGNTPGNQGLSKFRK